MDEVDFLELKHALDFAESVRKAKRQYNLSDGDLAEYLSITEKKVSAVLSGSYPFDIMIWARIEVMWQKLAAIEVGLDSKNIDE